MGIPFSHDLLIIYLRSLWNTLWQTNIIMENHHVQLGKFTINGHFRSHFDITRGYHYGCDMSLSRFQSSTVTVACQDHVLRRYATPHAHYVCDVCNRQAGFCCFFRRVNWPNKLVYWGEWMWMVGEKIGKFLAVAKSHFIYKVIYSHLWFPHDFHGLPLNRRPYFMSWNDDVSLIDMSKRWD